MIRLVRPPYKTDSICPPINLMALAGSIEPHHPVSIFDFVLPYIHGEMSLDGEGMRRAARAVLDDPALNTRERLLAQREAGTAILLISEDLEEITTLSDRIAVMYEGRIIGIVARGQASLEQIGLMMAGVPQAEALRQA